MSAGTATQSQVVKADGAATYTLHIAPTGSDFPDNVTFTASGVPEGASFTFSPAIVPANNGPATVNFTVQTASGQASNGYVNLGGLHNRLASVAPGTVITLTATVGGGPGTVKFCDASAIQCTDEHLLSAAQLTATGIATYKFVPGIGIHHYSAIFVGTTTHAASTSQAQTLTFAPPKIMLDAGMRISVFSAGDQTVHTAQFTDLPAPMQGIWKQWSSYTSDEPNGKALFDDMFHRFFFVHELGHWMDCQVIAGLPDSEMRVVTKNEAANKWESEITPNRIAVAWYREHDPQHLAKLVSDYRQILSHLPNPVLAGMDKKTYFTDNYQKLGTDPMAYGWYQLQMGLVVYDEPARSFQQVLDDLPKNRYE